MFGIIDLIILNNNQEVKQMCTAIHLNSKHHFFGRNFDVERTYGENVIIIPADYPVNLKYNNTSKTKSTILGIGVVSQGYPLMFDAINEHGLGVCALRYPDANYNKNIENKHNIPSYEFILYLLYNCSSCSTAINLLQNINITSEEFSNEFKPEPLHWMICDSESSFVLECDEKGIRIYENKIGVLTNGPDFKTQMFNLNNYKNLTTDNGKTTFSEIIDFNEYSRGMGAIGLPGDLSSMSRFVKAAFTKLNSTNDYINPKQCVGQFFHILNSVCQQEGCVQTENNMFDKTLYTSCYDLDNFNLYYTTYTNHRIIKINPLKLNYNKNEIVKLPLIYDEDILEYI